jgi:hypothetical protein
MSYVYLEKVLFIAVQRQSVFGVPKVQMSLLGRCVNAGCKKCSVYSERSTASSRLEGDSIPKNINSFGKGKH